MKKVLFGGSFDMFHSGHVDVLNHAKSYGDYLVVALTSDERIKFKKGDALPIYPGNERCKLVANLKMVDEAFIVQEKPEKNAILKAIKETRPDIYVRTAEVNNETILDEISLCKDLNIEMIIIPRLPGSAFRSSARIIKYIIDNFQSSEMEELIVKDETK